MVSKEKDKSDVQLLESYLSLPYLASLENKVICITGTSIGSLGYYTARVAVAKGAKLVILLNRDGVNAIAAEKDLCGYAASLKKISGISSEVKSVSCDLSGLYWVKSAAIVVKELTEEYGGVDVLANCAGVCAMRDERTVNGFDIQMQTNHISHSLLTMLLMESMELASKNRGEARVVNITCSSRCVPYIMLKPEYFLQCEPDELGGNNPWFVRDIFKRQGPFTRYQQSKLASACFSMALHMKLNQLGSKVKSLVADPGVVNTNLNFSAVEQGVMSPCLANSLSYVSTTPSIGVLSILVACFGDSSECKSGDLYSPAKISTGLPVKTVAAGSPVKSGNEKLVCHPTNIRTAWESTEKSLGVRFESEKDSKNMIGIRVEDLILNNEVEQDSSKV